ncbi:hypothetical protein NC653_018754 [Populus alba x Populus x berolinensis]|uniref:Uncharacterized protein n=1 Tax=Populus alba x Populus x berolinensis TaxID=444605 RepID=A0AAD6VW06_9ROSI|nr:hypothetical protein NC653_018754 [Populus alba x Populus x berolinensis]
MYKVGLTKFADLTNQEYHAMFLGMRSDPKHKLMKSKNLSERYVYKAEIISLKSSFLRRGKLTTKWATFLCNFSKRRFCGQYHNHNTNLYLQPMFI